MSGTIAAISASGDRVRCAARADDGRITAYDQIDEKRDVAIAFAALCERAGITPASLAGILVDVGPGSYTGLRVAVTFARTLAEFGRIPLFEITSLELLALAAAARGAGVSTPTRVRLVLDARRGRFHTGLVDVGSTIRMIEAPRAIDAQAVLAAIRTGETIVAEASVHPILSVHCAQIGVRLLPTVEIRAEDLFAPAIVARAVEPAQIEPLYLMGSYADAP